MTLSVFVLFPFPSNFALRFKIIDSLQKKQGNYVLPEWHSNMIHSFSLDANDCRRVTKIKTDLSSVFQTWAKSDQAFIQSKIGQDLCQVKRQCVTRKLMQSMKPTANRNS